MEGKARETFDVLVCEWMTKGESDLSREIRQEAIRRYVRAFGVEKTLLFDIRYQLLHRTLAAALASRVVGAKRAWMVVQSFAPLGCHEHAQNRADYDRYVALVGTEPVIENVPVRLAWVEEDISPRN